MTLVCFPGLSTVETTGSAWYRDVTLEGDPLTPRERFLERIRAEYPGGPQGVFLKRASGGLTVDVAGYLHIERSEAPERLLRELTWERRHVLQSAGFFDQLAWTID